MSVKAGLADTAVVCDPQGGNMPASLKGAALGLAHCLSQVAYWLQPALTDDLCRPASDGPSS